MAIVASYLNFTAWISPLLRKLEPPFALALRLWVGWQFVKSGWLKLTTFENTLYLFNEEYRVPLLPPELAAVMGTGGELVFGALVMAGLAGRLSAIGLSVVNLMAVVSYAHVLFAEGFEAALAQHYLWALMLMVIVVYGPGSWSLDRLIARWLPLTSRLRTQAV